MSARVAVLPPAIAAVISAACMARAKIDVFILMVLDCPGSAAEAACFIRTLEAHGRGVAPTRRSGQGSRGLVGRRTVKSSHKHVVVERMHRPHRMAHRHGDGRGWPRLHRLENAYRDQRAILTVLAVL